MLPPLGVDLGLDGVEQFGEPLDERLFPPSAAVAVAVAVGVDDDGAADRVELGEDVDDGRQLPEVVAVVVILQLET